jgi:hypothetical protein
MFILPLLLKSQHNRIHKIIHTISDRSLGPTFLYVTPFADKLPRGLQRVGHIEIEHDIDVEPVAEENQEG